MTAYKVVVDGSNIATEGRTLPSLNQLDEAVQSFMEEHPGADVLVIVDTSFAHRIDASEQPIFEAAYSEGEIIMPPAGTIGRGDSFILKVADKLGATVFSNDSFQEFHGTYDWLFDRGRLIGGKPVPGLGWVFMDRTPVRGPKSREAVREAKRTMVRIGSPEAMKPMPVPKAPPPFLTARAEAAAVGVDADPKKGHKGDRKRRKGSKGSAGRHDPVRPESAGAGDIAGESDARGGRKKKRRRSSGQGGGAERSVEPINDPLAFISFVSEHQLGSELDGDVESYSSHGMYVTAGGARCYVPFSGLADPMPRSAKEVVRKGEVRRWVVKSFDAPRRGIELALVGTPGAAAVDISAVLDLEALAATAEPSPPRRGRGRARTEAVAAEAALGVASPRRAAGRSAGVAVLAPALTEEAPAKRRGAKATASAKAAGKTVAKKAVAKKAVPVKAVAKKAMPVKAAAKKAVAKKAAPAKAAAKEAVAKKAAPAKAAAKKAAPAKSAGAVAKATPAPKATPARKVAVTKSAAPTAVAKKPASGKVGPAKAPAKKAPAKKAPAKK